MLHQQVSKTFAVRFLPTLIQLFLFCFFNTSKGSFIQEWVYEAYWKLTNLLRSTIYKIYIAVYILCLEHYSGYFCIRKRKRAFVINNICFHFHRKSSKTQRPRILQETH